MFAADGGTVISGAIGMATNGVPIYPYLDSDGTTTWANCGVDYCNARAGTGENYHYKGDPFGEDCLYDDAGYADLTHPPQIGIGLDGYPIHGRYISDTD